MSFQGPYFQKPENVLKRAEDFINIGKKEQALELLYELLSAGKYRQWQPAHEDVMKRFLELCVGARNNRMAKEGLHQYKNLAQNQAPNSLQVIIEYMLSMAEIKAKQASEQVNAKTVNDVEDLENDRSPEAILLAAVSSERSKERTEREHLVPWLKFLWESYRSVLEILRNNTKLEGVYHKTAHRGFAFCVEYSRNTEFRKLCEALRAHAVKQKEGDFTAESVELHLATRFEQLKTASTLRLWNEGFRTIEDIHNIFQKTDKRPSSQLEATYYQKLTDLFLVSENFLFHAYAYKAYYMLSVEKNKSLTVDQSKIMASCVLLSAMSIPLQSSKVGTTYATRESQISKNKKMAHLLGFDINPKRKSILQELLDEDILDVVIDEARDAYFLLEQTFAPLDLINKMVPVLDKFRADEKLVNYVAALEKLLVTRVVSQLAQVYYSVRLDTLGDLMKPLNKPFLEIENMIIKAVKSKQIDVHSVRFDHINGCVHFGEDFMEEQRTRRLLADMARGLDTICSQLEPKGKAKLVAEQRAVRAKTVLKFLDQSHAQVLRRKEIIDKRKEEFIRLQQNRKAENERRRKELERSRKEAEQARIERQRAQREQAQLRALEEEKRQFEIKQKLIQEGVDLSQTDLESMTLEEQQKLIEDTRKKAIQESLESEKKIHAAAKKLDTLVRALREKEIPKLRKLFREKLQEEEENFHKTWSSRIDHSKVEHENALKAKAEYAKTEASRKAFQDKLVSRWKAAYESERSRRWLECDRRLKQAKLERARKLKQRTEKELQRKKEEEARIARERQRQAEEEERRRKLELEEEKSRREQSDFRSTSDRPPSPAQKSGLAALEEDPRFAPREDRYQPPRDRYAADDRFNSSSNSRGERRFPGGDRFGGDDRFDRFGERSGAERGGERGSGRGGSRGGRFNRGDDEPDQWRRGGGGDRSERGERSERGGRSSRGGFGRPGAADAAERWR